MTQHANTTLDKTRSISLAEHEHLFQPSFSVLNMNIQYHEGFTIRVMVIHRHSTLTDEA
jgi:hypothetical protein